MRMKRLALTVLCLCLAVLPALTAAEDPAGPFETPAPAMTRDPGAGVYKPTPTPVPAPTRPNVVMMSMPTIDIEADTLDVWVYFPNAPQNEGWYDLAFTLWVALPPERIEEGVETAVYIHTNKETGEPEEVLYAKLFTSGLVPAGYCLQEITINQPVPEGSYRAVLTAQPYDVKTGQPTKNNGSTFVTLNAVRSQRADDTAE